MKLIRDVLDKQALDRTGKNLGKVDGILAEIRPGRPPRVVAVEIGGVALARRLGPRPGRWASTFAAWLGGERRREAYRIPLSRVRDIGIDIAIDLESSATPVFDWQDWLRDKIIRHIPGA